MTVGNSKDWSEVSQVTERKGFALTMQLVCRGGLRANSKSKAGSAQLFAASGVVGTQGMKEFWSRNYDREIGSGWAGHQIPRDSDVSL
eukprot:3057972-Ditylum_brightwellii.AAC.1